MNTQPKSEARIQEDAFAHIRLNYPETYGLIYHVPNGGLRDKISVRTSAGQGIVPGIQDIHFLWKNNTYVIEVKTPEGYCSVEQKLIHAVHALHGKFTYLFTSSEEIIRLVEAVINNQSLDQFSYAISPYCKPELVDFYKEEMRAERKKRAENRAKGKTQFTKK